MYHPSYISLLPVLHAFFSTTRLFYYKLQLCRRGVARSLTSSTTFNLVLHFSVINLYCSATVKISDSDYWSDRMAEYTGKPNRVVFDETLERAYKQLYDNSANIR